MLGASLHPQTNSNNEKLEDMTLNRLPYDLLLNIAVHLDLQDIHTLHLTCRSLYDFSTTRPVYRKLANDLLKRCRALPLKGFQKITDLTTEQLIRSVNKATRYETAWRQRAPRPIAAEPHSSVHLRSNYMDVVSNDTSPTSSDSAMAEANSEANTTGTPHKKNWYKIVRAPPGEDVDWLSPITSSYTLCATKSGKVVCWDVQTDTCLAEWTPGPKWELWKCRVEFEERMVYFTMAKIVCGSYDDERIMDFVLMRLYFSETSSGNSAVFDPPTFSHVTQFKTRGVVMNVFLLDPSARLLSAFVWIASSNSIGLFALLDWDRPEYVFIDTGIDCIMSSNWSCILYDNNIVIHCEESDAAFQHFFPISLLETHTRPYASKDSIPCVTARIPPPKTLKKKFIFPRIERVVYSDPSDDGFDDEEDEDEAQDMFNGALIAHIQAATQASAASLLANDASSSTAASSSSVTAPAVFPNPMIFPTHSNHNGSESSSSGASSSSSSAATVIAPTFHATANLITIPITAQMFPGFFNIPSLMQNHNHQHPHQHLLPSSLITASDASSSNGVGSSGGGTIDGLDGSTSTSATTPTPTTHHQLPWINVIANAVASGGAGGAGGGNNANHSHNHHHHIPDPTHNHNQSHHSGSHLYQLNQTSSSSASAPPRGREEEEEEEGEDEESAAVVHVNHNHNHVNSHIGNGNGNLNLNSNNNNNANDDVSMMTEYYHPSNPNPFPYPPWYPESAHFVRQWWPSLPGIPRVSCTVVLLATHDQRTHRTRFVLAQHYFRVPLCQEYHEEEDVGVVAGAGAGVVAVAMDGEGDLPATNGRAGGGIDGMWLPTPVSPEATSASVGGGGGGFGSQTQPPLQTQSGERVERSPVSPSSASSRTSASSSGLVESSPPLTATSESDHQHDLMEGSSGGSVLVGSAPLGGGGSGAVLSGEEDRVGGLSDGDDDDVDGDGGGDEEPGLGRARATGKQKQSQRPKKPKKEENDDDALMHLWYVSTPFEVVCVLDSSDDEDGTAERPRPLVAVDFGHAVWIEYIDNEDDHVGGNADEDIDYDAKWLRFVTFPPYGETREERTRREADEMAGGKGKGKARERDGDGGLGGGGGGRERDSGSGRRDPNQRSVGQVRTLEVPPELNLDKVETINIDQSQGAVILSVREGKIFILCYE